MRALKFLIPLILLFSQGVCANANDVINNSEKKSGLFNLYWDENNGDLYLQIPAFNQPFLYQTSLVRGLGSNDVGLDRGKLADTYVAEFQRHGNKVFLTALNQKFRANSKDPLERRSVEEAFADSVLWGATLVDTKSNIHLVKLNSLVIDDRQYLASSLKSAKQGQFKLDKSRSAIAAEDSKAFTKNTEVSAWLTLTSNKPGNYVRQVAQEPKAISLLVRHSFIELPDNKYQPRKFHPYSGFWAEGYQDYAAPIEQSMDVRFIPRHRLSKKQPDAVISEAVEPIIYYLDPGTPEPVRGALLDGARWWAQAFEAAGYRNAYQVKMLPADADPMDVRYNVIQWVHRATRGWSYGSSVIDPRTGEIVKGHVTLGSLRVRQDLLIARGLIPPFADADNGDDAQQQMALARIRQLSAHEVGHTLGIAHNFAASTNDRASVMDYPHPFVSLKAGKLSLESAYDTGIGEWDTQVIKYGYSDFGNADETAKLNQVLQQSRDMGLRYLSDPDARSRGAANPWASLWDNGADPVVELERLLKVREIALNNYSDAVLKSDRPLSDLQEALVPIYLLHRYQVQAAAKVIGGYDYGYWLKRDNKRGKSLDSKWQKRALSAVINTLSAEALAIEQSTLDILAPKAYGSYRNRESMPSKQDVVVDPLAMAEVASRHSLSWLLNPARLNRIYSFSSQGNKFAIDDLFDALWRQVLNNSYGDSQLQAIHKRVNFVTADALLALVHSPNLATEVKAQLVERIANWAKSKKSRGEYKAHYKWLTDKLQKGLSDDSIKLIQNPAKMPPGSPI